MSDMKETLENAKSAFDNAADKIGGEKYGKYIKIGAIILAVILAFLLVRALFGDKKAKAAEKEIVSQYTELFKEAGVDNFKIKTKAIGKNKGSHLYAFDVTIKAKAPSGEKLDGTVYIIVYSDGDTAYMVRDYEYDKENKRDIRELVFSALVRG